MSRRIMDVNAYTTLDFAEGVVERPDGREEATAVVNATHPRDGPDHVELQVEMDATDVDLPAHADTVQLTPAQARELAADLEDAADSVESGGSGERSGRGD
jgi:hypothetical protein